jgi:hypothetical protein
VPWLAARNRRMWHKRDRSQDFVDQCKKDRPIENADIEPYALTREHIVRRANPTLNPEAVAAIVDATAGMVEAQIEEVARRYAPDNPLPRRPPFSWCRNPVTGEYCERLLNPFEICGLMSRHGFRASVSHVFRRPPLRWINRTRVRTLNRLLFCREPRFIVVGRKT